MGVTDKSKTSCWWDRQSHGVVWCGYRSWLLKSS